MILNPIKEVRYEKVFYILYSNRVPSLNGDYAYYYLEIGSVI